MTKSILIIEDDSRLAEHWQGLLEQAGYYVIREDSVDAGISVVENEKIDLVICDILFRDATGNLGPRGGFSFLSHLNLNVQDPPKVLAVSGANSTLGIQKHAVALQASKALSKPVSDEHLLDEVAALLT